MNFAKKLKNNQSVAAEAISEPCQKIERFAKIVNGSKPLTVFVKRFIVDV